MSEKSSAALSGAAAGASAGSAAGPWGALIGGVAGGAIGYFGTKEDNSKGIPLEDPAQIARLREIDATRKQISEGRDPLTLQRISDIKNIGETTKGQLGKFTGGDVGGTISAMLRTQRNTGQGINQAYTESQQRIPFFESLAGQLGNRVEQRRLELGIHELDRSRAQALQSQTNKQNNLMGLMSYGSGLFGKRGSNPAQQMTANPQSSPSNLGGGGVNSVGQFSPALQTPILEESFNQGLAGNRDAIAGNPGFGGFNSMGQPESASFNVSGGFGQQLGGGFGGMGGGNAFMERQPVGVNDYANYVNG